MRPAAPSASPLVPHPPRCLPAFSPLLAPPRTDFSPTLSLLFFPSASPFNQVWPYLLSPLFSMPPAPPFCFTPPFFTPPVAPHFVPPTRTRLPPHPSPVQQRGGWLGGCPGPPGRGLEPIGRFLASSHRRLRHGIDGPGRAGPAAVGKLGAAPLGAVPGLWLISRLAFAGRLSHPRCPQGCVSPGVRVPRRAPAALPSCRTLAGSCGVRPHCLEEAGAFRDVFWTPRALLLPRAREGCGLFPPAQSKTFLKHDTCRSWVISSASGD